MKIYKVLEKDFFDILRSPHKSCLNRKSKQFQLNWIERLRNLIFNLYTFLRIWKPFTKYWFILVLSCTNPWTWSDKQDVSEQSAAGGSNRENQQKPSNFSMKSIWNSCEREHISTIISEHLYMQIFQIGIIFLPKFFIPLVGWHGGVEVVRPKKFDTSTVYYRNTTP